MGKVRTFSVKSQKYWFLLFLLDKRNYLGVSDLKLIKDRGKVKMVGLNSDLEFHVK